MKNLSGLTGFFAVILVTGAILLVLALLVSQGITDMITPPAEQTAEGLVKALGAHRYEGVINQLSEELAGRVDQEQLEELVKAIESSHEGIEDASGQEAQEQDQTATASVQVKTKDLQEFDLEFHLKQENGLWKVTSLTPLQILASE